MIQRPLKPKQPSPVHQRIVAILKKVPRGTVATYAQIAHLAGCPRHVRQVVWALHSSSEKHRLPWHRIINAQGRIGHVEDEARMRQRALLEAEGIVLDLSGKIDLKRFAWKPKIVVGKIPRVGRKRLKPKK